MTVSSLNINGELRITEVTVGTNSISNASQLFPYFSNFLESGETLLLFAATSFTTQQNGVKYGFKKGMEAVWSGTVSNSGYTFGRYRDGSMSEFLSASSSYDAKLKAGDTYVVLYARSFSKVIS